MNISLSDAVQAVLDIPTTEKGGYGSTLWPTKAREGNYSFSADVPADTEVLISFRDREFKTSIAVIGAAFAKTFCGYTEVEKEFSEFAEVLPQGAVMKRQLKNKGIAGTKSFDFEPSDLTPSQYLDHLRSAKIRHNLERISNLLISDDYARALLRDYLELSEAEENILEELRKAQAEREEKERALRQYRAMLAPLEAIGGVVRSMALLDGRIRATWCQIPDDVSPKAIKAAILALDWSHGAILDHGDGTQSVELSYSVPVEDAPSDEADQAPQDTASESPADTGTAPKIEPDTGKAGSKRARDRR